MNKNGFGNILLLVILGVILIGGISYITITKTHSKPITQVSPIPVVTTQTPVPSATATPVRQDSSDITLYEILNSLGFHNGVRHGSDKSSISGSPEGLPVENMNKDMVVFGDLDDDGHVEAAVSGIWCHASCGTIIYIYKKENGKIFADILREVDPTSGKQAITSMTIKTGVLSVTKPESPDYLNKTHGYRVKFINGKLQVLPIQ